jgi:protein translocase SecG subunit
MLAAAASPAPAGLPSPIPITLPPNVFHTPTFAEQHPFFVHAIETLFFISTVGIIALMSVQTTKTEGLSGSIGGRAESAYHGRLGFEQQLTRVTTVTAVAWIVLAIVYFVVNR